MDNPVVWDIFYKPGDPSGLWFACQLAHALGAREQRVRLFCHDVPGLAASHGALDAQVLLQNLGNLEILDLRLARSVAASPNLIEVFGARPPADYMARYFSQSRGGSWYTLHSPWQRCEVQTPIRVSSQSQAHRQFDVFMGELPDRAGLIHGAGGVKSGVPCVPGISPDLLARPGSVYLGAAGATASSAWVRSLIDDATRRCIFVEQGAALDQLAPILSAGRPQPGPCTLGSLTLIGLPPLPWHQLDGILGSCDLVLTDRMDLAFRAAERGVPVVVARALPDGEDVNMWTLRGADAALVACHQHAAKALSTGANAQKAVADYLARLGNFRQQARQLGHRIAAAPELVELLLASSEISLTDHVERLFAPTEPNPMV